MKTLVLLPLALLLLLSTTVWSADLDIKEPDNAAPATARKPERARWSWNNPYADFTPTGDLVYKPEPYTFEAGASLRYIDFDAGNDDNAGDAKTAAWKHHPWDPAATGKAKACHGIHTYVFKRGVVYRGLLIAAESGDEHNPIRLTSDPQWNSGNASDEAILSGAERVTKWTKGATNTLIPNAEQVWYADLDFAPRNVFEVKDGKVERLNLARTPNWKESDAQDVLKEWWTWQQPEWWAGKCFTKINGHDAHLGIDAAHLTQPADYYVGATVRTEFGFVMGTPFPTEVEGFDAAKKAVIFQGLWWGNSEHILTKNRYYLEDKPQYLDEAGEFWFEKKDAGGRLFLRLPGDRDPNQAVVEAARHINLIEDVAHHEAPPRLDIIGDKINTLNVTGISHVVISGLAFRCTNTHWELSPPPWMHKDIDNACILLNGSTDDLRIEHCHFEYAGKAINIKALTVKVRTDRIVIADNLMEHIDHGAVAVLETSRNNAWSYLGDVKFLRNKLFDIGARAYRQDWSHAVNIEVPVTMEVAGNYIEHVYGAGLFLMRGKDLGGANPREIPLGRALVHDNRVVDSLLTANDWGGIEVNGGGPAYVYNNISGNANGYWNWTFDPNRPASARLGMAYYLDGGGSRTFLFNNVAWGNTDDPKSKLCSHCAFYEAGPNVFNWYFNNTACNFYLGSNWSPAGGRYMSLGNIWTHISNFAYLHGKVKEDKDPPPAGEYPLFGDAYGRNIFHACKNLAIIQTNHNALDTIEAFDKALTETHSLTAKAGAISADSPVLDFEHHDFRPAPKSAAVDQGTKVFTPWSLYAEVGAWTFRKNNQDPAEVLDEHFFMASYVGDRIEYTHKQLFHLKGTNITGQNYVASPLENWTTSALKLNGKDQFLTLAQAALGDEKIASPNIGATNFLIETYFRTEPGHNSSVIVSKFDDAGYQLALNKAGGISLSVRSGSAKADLASGAKVNDGQWHHVLAEVDRHGKTATIYTDGVKTASGPLNLDESASLSNKGDLLVGKNSAGLFFAGELSYLRITRGTLADARTTIEELYDWEFDGPSLRDFCGHEAVGAGRDAGAYEASRK